MDGQPEDAQRTGTIKLPGGGVDAAAARREARPEWVEQARTDLAPGGRYLAFEESGRRTVVPVSREWTRIGRSLGADLRFDDATVSRRHALVAVDENGARVLDDRSLNGITVNGTRVETSPLTDGDEIGIGRHVLYFLEGEPATQSGEPTASTLAR
jgi:pSer/pThr/pTyr-binding forkhead associated (FHA) protein